jgi:hypothetical protein
MLFRKITVNYSENHEEDRNTLWTKCLGVFLMLKYAACSSGSRPALQLDLYRSHLTTTQAKQANENMKAKLIPCNEINPVKETLILFRHRVAMAVISKITVITTV